MTKVYHIPACIRCHSKKIRCDTDRPRCRQCARADTSCEFKVSTSSQNAVVSPRGHISALESRLYELEADYTLSKLDREEAALSTPCNGPERATLKQSAVKQLIKTYFSHCQFPYLILLEDEFSKKVEDVYAKYGDIFANSDEIPDKIFFMASMVMAISLLSLACRAPKAKSLAEVTFTRAIGRLNRILSREKDAEMLQCVLLLLLYSMRHCTSLAHPWYVSGIAQKLCREAGLYDGTSLQNRTGLCLTSWSMDLGLSKAPFRVKDWVVEEGLPESLQEQQTMHFIQLQRLQDLVTTRLYTRSNQDQDEDRHRFIVAMVRRLEDWKTRAQQLATADIHTTNLWELWYCGTALRLLRPLLPQQPTASNSLQRCYSFSTEIIDISFAQLFIRQHVPVTYSCKDICDIVLAGVTFLYIISTSKNVIEDDAPSLSRQSAKLTAILKTTLQNWPQAARVQQLLLSLAKHSMDNMQSGGADGSYEGEQQSLSKRPKIILDTNKVPNLSCSEDDDTVDLPVPRAKVRHVLAHHDSESEAQKNGTNDGLQESFFNHEFVGQHRVRIMSTILGISPPQIEGEYLWDGMNGYRAFLEFVDVLHCAQIS